MRHPLVLLLACLVAPSASAGLLSRANVDGERVDMAAAGAERPQRVTITGIYIYSFLLEAVERDSRLGRGIARFPEVLSQQIQS
ncbi:hypothetical protein ACF3M1_01365 [Luteimonas sp. WGS1318]|uniref:hypothetical protein n=1 Tax=Luteimonas sp. WGS1318 TaxID=3366815 RepID=UPI00372D1C00